MSFSENSEGRALGSQLGRGGSVPIVLRRIVGRLLLVATVSVGVLLMHGLVLADHGMRDRSDAVAMASDAPMTSPSTIADAQLAMGAHAGEVCLWVLVAGVAVAATLLARRQRGTDLAESLRSAFRMGRALPGPAPPAPASLDMLGVLLR
jgi:hypothetical protein